MSAYSPEQIAEILRKHASWVRGDVDGIRASLVGANLDRANLVGASLVGARLDRASLVGARLDRASLVGARLDGANLDGASLVGASLVGARLDGANLDGASLVGASLVGARLVGARLVGASLVGARLDKIREDVRAVLDAAPNEVSGLLAALRNGRVDGSTYDGECACLVGTIANVRKCDYRKLGDLEPDSDRPAERWFLAIRKGHRPDWCPVARITDGWIAEWMTEHGQVLPLSTEAQLEAALKRIAELEGAASA